MTYSFSKYFSRHSFAIAILLVAPGAFAQQNPPSPPAATTAYPTIPGVQIKRAEFGVFRDLGSTTATLDTARVVSRDKRPIGWVIELDTLKPTVRWREEFTVPSPPQHWGLSSDKSDVRATSLSADRLTASTERRVAVGAGTISHTWRLDATDPSGPHRMRVYVEDVLVGDFAFEVN